MATSENSDDYEEAAANHCWSDDVDTERVVEALREIADHLEENNTGLYSVDSGVNVEQGGYARYRLKIEMPIPLDASDAMMHPIEFPNRG